MAEISPWSALYQLEVMGMIEPGEKPTRQMMDRMNELLHDANEKHYWETGKPLYREYFVPNPMVPIELADGTQMIYW